MRRIAIAAVPLLALMLVPRGASAALGRHALPAKCAPNSEVLFADAQAQVYAVRKGPLRYLSIRGCSFGQRRSFFVSACGNKESAVVCAERSKVSLVGTIVASEEAFNGECRCSEKSISEWHVVVQNVHTGEVLHEVPTGTPLKPERGYVGVGPIVGLVLKSDGSVAWIAEDYERSSVLYGAGAPYFDVYATDRAGTRLLAAGTNIDPSSLALSVGGTGVGGSRQAIAGGTLYWTQGGKSESAVLN